MEILFIIVYCVVGIVVPFGLFTGAVPLILELPLWASVSFLLTQVIFGATIYLLTCRIKWKWLFWVAALALAIVVRNETGAKLALSVLSWWREIWFLASIYLIGFFAAILLKEVVRKRSRRLKTVENINRK
jgi:hypothetical protein